jgi:hypothetical protein
MLADISGYTADGPTAPMRMEFQGADAPWKPEQRAKILAMAPAMIAAANKGKATGWGYPMMMQSFAPAAVPDHAGRNADHELLPRRAACLHGWSRPPQAR